MTPNKIKAIIFDMDGVLIDAKEWHYFALNKALALFGHEISRYDHLVTYDGLPTVVKLDLLSRERELPVKLHDFINEIKQQYTMDLVYAHCKPTFYHEFALSKLKSKGYLIGCASNSIKSTIDVMLSKSNLLQYMDVIFSAQDVENPKPAPDIYISAMNALGVSPKECLIVEDNENGIKSARESGANLLIVSHTDEVNIDNVFNAIKKFESMIPTS
jgi:beta-phosphoglucomutase-like phosphatase (HAD superfamily)